MMSAYETVKSMKHKNIKPRLDLWRHGNIHTKIDDLQTHRCHSQNVHKALVYKKAY